MFPQGTGSPGNRGTVDIGSSNNSTADIARQIVHGISPSDFAQLGGKLEFDDSGKLYLNGDTGISAGVKDELASIMGQPRIIPIFSTVSGNGNNATVYDRQMAGRSHRECEAHWVDVAKKCHDPSSARNNQGSNPVHNDRHEQLRVFTSCTREVGAC